MSIKSATTGRAKVPHGSWWIQRIRVNRDYFLNTSKLIFFQVRFEKCAVSVNPWIGGVNGPSEMWVSLGGRHCTA